MISDPATKIKWIKLDAPNVNVYYLVDEGNVSIYETDSDSSKENVNAFQVYSLKHFATMIKSR
jgi:hypothetical protein